MAARLIRLETGGRADSRRIQGDSRGEAMDFGLLCLAKVDSWKDVVFAEANGFTHAWIADSQMVWADPYQCLALCAVNTRTIKLGTNVTNPASRISPVTACSFATLNAL